MIVNKKTPAGIDFNVPIKAKKQKIEVKSEPIYLDNHYDEHKMGNINIFEEVVDLMMLDYFDEKFKKQIKGLPRRQKRMMILALLDKERNLFLKAKALIEDDIPKLKHIKDLILILREYVHVGEVEKKKHGEVMTPLELVKDMLNKLPNKVWSNPNLKWLDSCNGTGPFMAMVVYKLMTGLSKWEPNENKRYKHIVENMIYCGELQPKNQFLWITLMDPYDEFNMNVYTGSFLDERFDKHMKDVWNIEKFDIIVGNPPYQKNIKGGSTDKPIWHFFVEKYFSVLRENGYLTLVHPSGWRSIKTFENIKNVLLSKDISFLKMHSFKEGQDTFNAAINFDYYCLNNSENKGKTRIVCEDKEELDFDLRTTNVIPSENILEILSLIAKEGEEKVELISNSSYHTSRDYISKQKEENGDFIYPCVYTVKTSNIPTLKWSNMKEKGHFGLSKAIFARGASGVIADIEGRYGMTEFAYGIVDSPENIENIVKAISSERFIKKIMLFKNSLGDRYNRKLIAQFRKDFWKEFV